MVKVRQQSRPKRWLAATNEARKALDALDAAYSELEMALGSLKEVQDEYSDWKDNLPENLSSSNLSDKLETICNLDIPDDPRDTSYSDLDDLIGEAEGADMPMGFGRD